MNDLPPALADTLATLAEAARDLVDPWWVFGGAAMILAGLDDLHAPDVDVLASPRDALTLLERLGGRAIEDPGEGIFRSRVFGHVLTTPVPIDVMTDMDVRGPNGWTPVRFAARQAVQTPRGSVFIPPVAEQIDTCRLFGRPKDLQRADRLTRLGGRP